MIRFALILLMSLAVSSQAVAAVKFNNSGIMMDIKSSALKQNFLLEKILNLFQLGGSN